MHAQTRRARTAAAKNALTLRELVVITGLLAILFVAASATGFRRDVAPDRLSAVRVGQGQTLWEIAEDVELPGLTTAEKVVEIQRLNDLTGASIAAGTVVQIPASEAFQDAVAMR